MSTLSNLASMLHRATELPWPVLVRKVRGRIGDVVGKQRLRRRDMRQSTYLSAAGFAFRSLHRGAFQIPPAVLRPAARWIAGVAMQYVEHRFDLLGSGWTTVTYGARCRGLHGIRYEASTTVQIDDRGEWLRSRVPAASASESARIWRLIEAEYQPIDWQLDWKSGYRWSEQTWFRDVRRRCPQGADIKLPWELARMQHLAILAHAFVLSTDNLPGMRPPEEYRREFRNQIIDFIATNPPRFGANWACTMDVAIRVANWIVAFDLFRNGGAKFDAAFESLLARSVLEHASFIVENLEWSPDFRGNHYLANIVGLLFCAVYLPSSPNSDAWLAFAVQELVAGVGEQFLPEGANFEASTCYHRLSAEMVVYGTALVLGLPPERLTALTQYDHRLMACKPRLRPAPVALYCQSNGPPTPFPAWYCERLERMAEFAMHLLKPNAHVAQIGDNDSGRFLKLQPVYHERTVADAVARYENLSGYSGLPDDESYWDEEHLDHRHIIAAINGLFGRPDLAHAAGDGWWELALVRTLAKGARLASSADPASFQATHAEQVRVGSPREWEQSLCAIDALPTNHRRCIQIGAPGSSLRNGLSLYGYPAFGLYVFRSDRVFLSVRCGAIGQNGYGGHAHSDQLAVELQLDGRDVLRDPGTYLYTPLPDIRNAYRSARVHAGPWWEGEEPCRLDHRLFVLRASPLGTCTYFGEHGFAGIARSRHGIAHGLVCVEDNTITILHGLTEPMRGLAPLITAAGDERRSAPYSPGYGLWQRQNMEFSASDLPPYDVALRSDMRELYHSLRETH